MLVNCPECGLQVSDMASACPHCGYPMRVTPVASPRKQRKPNKRRRLPNGFGQISEIKGRNLRKPFRAMVTVGKTSTGRPICKPLKPDAYFETYNDAYQALVEYHRNPYDIDPGITVKELYEKWSEGYYKKFKSEKQAIDYNRAWEYASILYPVKVKDVRVRHLKNCLENGKAVINGEEKEISAWAQTYLKSIFNMMFDYAAEYEITDCNFARQFSISKDVKKQPKSRLDHNPFTDDEMNILWNNLDFDGVDNLLIQCYSGWRPQELGLILLSDVDLERRTFTGGIKTDAGTNRTVPIHSRIFPLVEKKYQEALKLESEYLMNYMKGRDGTFFLTYDRYSKQFALIKKKLGLGQIHRPHDGRKHFVSMAKRYNVDEYAIKYFVGHVITDLTERVYTKRDPEWFHSEIEKIK